MRLQVVLALKKKERPTSTKEDMVNYLQLSAFCLCLFVLFFLLSLICETGGKLETHLDSYGSLANTSIAEDGDFEEHSC